MFFKKTIALFGILIGITAYAYDVKISNLPLGTAANSTANDVFPFVSYTDGLTKKMALWDLLNLPPLSQAFLNLPSPQNHGVVISGSASVLHALTPSSSTAYALLSGGSSADPLWGLLSVGGGGTGLASGTSGGLLYFNGSTTMASTAVLNQFGVLVGGGVAAGPSAIPPNASTAFPLVSGGVSSNPSWSALTIPGGGTGQTSKAAAFDALSPTSTVGDTIYYTGGTNAALAGNTSSTKEFLTSTGTGSSATAPSWGTLASGDLPVVNNSNLATMASSSATVGTVKGNISGSTATPSDLTLTSANTASSVIYRDGSGNFSAGTISAALTGTASGNTSYTANQYGVVLSGSGNTMSVLTPSSSTVFPLVSGGASSNPSWTGLTVGGGGTGLTSGTSGGVPYFSSASAMTSSALLAQYGVVLGGGSGAAPATLAPNASTAFPLVSGGSSANPSWTGLTVPGGGTGLTSGTSGGIPYFSSSSAMSSSVVLPAGQLFVGGGPGGSPSPLPSGTPGFLLQANGSSAPTWISNTPTFSGLTTDGLMYATSSTQLGSTAAGTTGQVPMATASSAPTWATVPGNTSILKSPTVSNATASGTGTGGFGSSQGGWLFTVTAWTGTLAIGDTYTNNGHTYTAIVAQTNGGSGQTLWMSGTGATSGTTLTKGTSASGPSTITFSANNAYYTYTTPTNPSPLYLKVKMVGAGGGASGSGTTGGGNGGSGTISGFGALFLVAGGGTGGVFDSASGAAGGTASIGSGGTGITVIGGSGGGYGFTASAVSPPSYQGGASAYFGGAGNAAALSGSSPSGIGGAGLANTGGGGGGSGTNGTANGISSSTGAGGGFLEAFVGSPSSTYVYVIGTGGSGGSNGTNGFTGGAGGSGFIEVMEHYQ